MDSIIEFKRNSNGYIMCIITTVKNGKEVSKKVTNPVNVRKILELAYSFGYKRIKVNSYIDGKDAKDIIRRYDRFYRNKKQDTLSLVIDKINGKMIVNRAKSRKNVGNRYILPIMLATTIALSGFGISMSNHNQPDLGSDTALEQYDENYVYDEDIEIDIQEEIQQMLMENEQDGFTINYQSRINSDSYNNASRYDDLYTKYGNMYGVDPSLLKAIAAQESSGDHYNNIESGAACGLMQIEKSVALGNTYSAYNYQTNQTDSITPTLEDLQDLETNVRLGAMIYQNCLTYENYNPILALQTYNFGAGNINKVLNICSENTGISIEELKSNYNTSDWIEYRNYLDIGDPQYVEHVLSYLNKDHISVKDGNNTITVNINNELNKNRTY